MSRRNRRPRSLGLRRRCQRFMPLRQRWLRRPRLVRLPLQRVSPRRPYPRPRPRFVLRPWFTRPRRQWSRHRRFMRPRRRQWQRRLFVSRRPWFASSRRSDNRRRAGGRVCRPVRSSARKVIGRRWRAAPAQHFVRSSSCSARSDAASRRALAEELARTTILETAAEGVRKDPRIAQPACRRVTSRDQQSNAELRAHAVWSRIRGSSG
jgi:hypothetical protein